ncbi:MAG: hypothetical protein DRQ44_02810 [Gammaproteobacteria bacterium]|nr:MAG: hypothetical protein DRQ44_02810 [Gammaproteobacteria bacterium]
MTTNNSFIRVHLRKDLKPFSFIHRERKYGLITDNHNPVILKRANYGSTVWLHYWLMKCVVSLEYELNTEAYVIKKAMIIHRL